MTNLSFLKWHLFILGFLLFGVGCSTGEPEPEARELPDLLVVMEEDRKGVYDLDGNEILPVLHKEIYYSEGVIMAQAHWLTDNTSEYPRMSTFSDEEIGNWAYFDPTGEKMTEYQFPDAEPFQDGMAAVSDGFQWGFIDKSGELVITPRYSEVRNFSGELAAAKVAGEWGYVDKAGNWVIEPQYEIATRFEGNFASVSREDSDSWGMINRKGEAVIPLEHNFIYPFVEGKSKVYLGGENVMVIDTNGQVVIPKTSARLYYYQEGMIPEADLQVRRAYASDLPRPEERRIMRRYEDRYLDEKGFSDYKSQRRREFLVYKGDIGREARPTWGYRDASGKLVISYQYDQADRFYRGKAIVFRGMEPMLKLDRYDDDGNLVPTLLDELGLGANLIDKAGNELLDDPAEQLELIPEIGYLIERSAGYGLLSLDLEELIPPSWQFMQYIGFGYFLAMEIDSRKEFLITREGKVVREVDYAQMEAVSKDRFIVKDFVYPEEKMDGYRFGLQDLKGNWIMEPDMKNIYFVTPNSHHERNWDLLY